MAILGMSAAPASLAALLVLGLGAGGASAAQLLPHRAVYDLALDQATQTDFDSIDGRIVVEITQRSCEAYELDYRFVARFLTDRELTVVDQHIELEEPVEGESLRFSSKSTVDGLGEQASAGTATTRDGRTQVDYREPDERDVDIPAAAFPIAHTRNLIDAARSGAFVYETAIFDGDAEAEKETRSTSIIASLAAPGGSQATADETAVAEERQEDGPAGKEREGTPAEDSAGARALRDHERWRVSEAYYDKTGSADGAPDFTTSYTLYDNGVSDDLTMNFDGYSLTGSMSEFTPLGAEDCKPSER
ncbi:DUF1849 family protein [Fulvimarina endophytica]|uniref:DUF1849 family protein n=1 Tax=Fulvimarina endophytica TaxID=2293836 RepID=A0A371X062_9HYPH|nr:DUF1849 family protein [Fulvimarina endophytica]RFC62424.1 DUF1849 family protein [Fulvimarina endophytica]